MKYRCEWEPQGNGHYLTACGKLYRDDGRFRAMMIKVYNSKKPPLPIKKICPNCGRLINNYGEADYRREG